jgi:lactam utilization protein B
MEGQSVCVHGDGPTALKTAQHIRQGLEAAGFEMCGLDEICRGP